MDDHLECFVEESVPALNHNESKLMQCADGVTQCLYAQLMVKVYGNCFLFISTNEVACQ